jgi:hypothetical protein
MEAAFATISSLGLMLDLMLQRVLTRMCKGAQRGAAALAHGWPEMEAGRVCAWEQDGRKIAGQQRKRKRQRREEEERGMGSTPPRAALFIGGSTKSTRCGSFRRTTRLNSSIREVCKEIKADFSLTDYSYDLNLSLGRQLNNKTTSGRPDGKHVLQAPTSHLFRSLTNHFIKRSST